MTSAGEDSLECVSRQPEKTYSVLRIDKLSIGLATIEDRTQNCQYETMKGNGLRLTVADLLVRSPMLAQPTKLTPQRYIDVRSD